MVLKKLRIEELFTFKKGTNEFNKKVIFENAGSIPVYSGQTKNEGIIGYVNDAKYEGTYIRITTVGANAGHVDIIKGKFCLAQNNGILVPIDIQKNKNIDLTYISLQLKDKLKGLSKGEGYNSLLKADIENCHILLPTKEDGTFDLETQKKVVDKYTEVEAIKKYIAKLIEEIEEKGIEIENQFNVEKKKLKDIFDLTQKSNNSKFTKTFINNHKGEIPVYGASAFEDEVSYGYVADNLDGVKYFEDCLTWNIDGSTGIVFYREGRFSLSEKVLPLIISKNYGETLLPEYLKIVLEIESKKKGFSRSNKAGKTKIQNILLPIPIKEDDTIDLEIQEEIIKKYKYVNKVKKKLLTELTELINTKVEVE